MCYMCGWRQFGTRRPPSFLTEHRADLVGQHRVGVVQPAAAAQALLEAVEDGLVGEQHHQDPQRCRDRAGVEVLLHEHQQPVEAQRPDQLLTRSEDGGGSEGEGGGEERKEEEEGGDEIVKRLQVDKNVKMYASLQHEIE